ncbi:MAG: Rrf2 family transcriptional regulator [Myxococcota bacterium]
MQLTQHTDFALRTLLYLALHDERPVSVREVAEAYGISRHHLTKVARTLSQHGYIKTIRGHTGGMRLDRPANDINIGAMVRAMEPHFGLVACFPGNTTGHCCIAPACGLTSILHQAMNEFFAVLDRYTLADCMTKPSYLRALLHNTTHTMAAGK